MCEERRLEVSVVRKRLIFRSGDSISYDGGCFVTPVKEYNVRYSLITQ